MSRVVAFRDVSYEIAGKLVLRNLSFEVAAGETLVLLGRSGSGKTTALKMVNRLLEPTVGQVVVGDAATTAWDPIRLRRRIGYVIQEVGLFPHFTVTANVGVVPALEGWDGSRVARRVRELLESVGLEPEEYGGRYPRELSGGERQRVGVARALAADPDFLLFDEPFGALDPVTRRKVQGQFLELRRSFGKTALFVTHDIHEALAIGSRIGLLHKGRLEFIGTPEEFLAAETTEARAFLACLVPGAGSR